MLNAENLGRTDEDGAAEQSTDAARVRTIPATTTTGDDDDDDDDDDERTTNKHNRKVHGGARMTTRTAHTMTHKIKRGKSQATHAQAKERGESRQDAPTKRPLNTPPTLTNEPSKPRTQAMTASSRTAHCASATSLPREREAEKQQSQATRGEELRPKHVSSTNAYTAKEHQEPS
mmetsp:Transcript_1034/g.3366  ORF Transcript_1034/g.3366 Transcript_1034/m.3366 type:complete len:175 (+) Transcript_1034:1417-1941(+)